MTVEEAQTRKDKILAEARKEKPFPDHPQVSYEVLKQFEYVDSPDSFASPPSDPEDTPKEVEARNKRYKDAYIQNQIITPHHIKIKANENGLPCTSQSETEVETDKDEEAQACQDKFLAGTKNEQLFRYNPSVKYEPLKRYIVPRFAFFDSSSTDWSASSDSESETETMAGREAQTQEDKIPAGTKEEHIGDDVIRSPSTDLHSVAAPSSNFQSKPAVSDPSLLVNPGAKIPAEDGDKV